MVIEEVKPEGDEGTECVSVEEVYLSMASLPHPFLLEKGGAGEGDVWTFAGADPFLVMEARGREIRISEKEARVEVFYGDPLEKLDSLLAQFRDDSDRPFPFKGGAVGYLGYECGQYVEKVPGRKGDELKIPDLRFAFYDTVLILNTSGRKLYVVSTGFPEKGAKRKARAARRAAYFKELVSRGPERMPGGFRAGPARSNMTRREYVDAVVRIKEYIAAGDIYQVNLAQRFSCDFEGDAYGLYRRFREANPVPFGAFLHYPDLDVVSNSPERFLSLRGGVLESRPIKGTIRRGEMGEDEHLKKKLAESVKDNAEHIMIVDLVRNDLGRVCRYGSVKAKELKRIESYANLHHMVSVVSGEIREGVRSVDCIRAAFPGGSITGAPKMRAMEIIHEVEPAPRSVYTGSIGYLGFDGSMDLNIAIRTAFVTGGKACFSVGGGIVADSDPDAEYEETLLKGEIFSRIISGKEIICR